MTARSSARYLARIFKNHPNRQTEHGLVDSPKATPIQSVLGNEGDILTSPLIAFFFMLGYPFHTSKQGTLNLHWPEDRVEIILRTAYLLQLVSLVLIFVLYLRMFRKEIIALCLISHGEWCCNQCGVKYETREEMHTPQEVVHVDPYLTRIRPESILKPGLVISLIVTASILYLASTLLWNTDRHNSCLLSVFALANIVQNVCHLKRLRDSHSCSGEDTDLLPSDIVARTRRTVMPMSTQMLLALVFAISAFYMTLGREVTIYGFRNIPYAIVALFWIESIIIVINASQTFRICKQDGRAAAALCPQHGHNWVCGRGCSTKLKSEGV